MRTLWDLPKETQKEIKKLIDDAVKLERTKYKVKNELNYVGKKIRLIDFVVRGKVKYPSAFSNMKPLSIHVVIEPPIGYKQTEDEVWIIDGNGNPYPILRKNFTWYETKN